MPDFGSFRGFGEKLTQGQTPTQLGKIGSENVNPPILNSYPNAQVAYSLRKLRLEYSGSAIRVRRSSDNAEQDIGFVNGNLDTASLTSFCGAGDGYVTTWYDQSGNGNNATQTTAGNQPLIYQSNVIFLSTKPSVLFNNAFLTMNSSISLQNFTILWVSKKDTAGNQESMILTDSGFGGWIGDDINGNGNPNIYWGGNDIIALSQNNTSASNLETTYHLSYANRRLNTQAVGQFNGSNNSYNNSISSATISINCIANTGYGGFRYAGKIQEIIIYSIDKSTDKIGIQSNINTYYAIY